MKDAETMTTHDADTIGFAGPGRGLHVVPFADLHDDGAFFQNLSVETAAALSTDQGATGNPYIDGVLFGIKWAATDITFSFPQSPDEFPEDYGIEPSSQFAPISAAQQEVVRAALTGTTVNGGLDFLTYNAVTAFTNLRITEANGPGAGLDASGDIRLAESNFPPTAYASYPGEGRGGDIWFGTAYAGTIYDYRTPLIGNYAYQTVLHELGHALGLKHSQEGGGPGDTAVPPDRDALEFSVMAYRSFVGGSIDGYSYEQFGAPQTYMMLDIAALQAMYGANYTTYAGDTTYRWDPTTGRMSIKEGAGAFVGQGIPGDNRIFLTTWDGGGYDTYDMSNYATGVSIDLRPGQWSITAANQLAHLGYVFDGSTTTDVYAQGNVYNAYLYNDNPASLIENAMGGTGDDTIVGNEGDNILTGNAGRDIFTGGDGEDIFRDTAANLDGDTILDFGSFDFIEVSDAVAAVYDLTYAGSDLSFSLTADATLTYTITLLGDALEGTFEQRAGSGGGVDIYFKSIYSLPTPTVKLAAASDTGISNADGVTKLSDVTVTGQGTPGSFVNVFDDGNHNGVQDSDETTLATALVAAGAATYTLALTLLEGQHALRAYQTDAAGEFSAISAAALVTVDLTAPHLTASASDMDLIKGETATVTFQFSEAVSNFLLSDITVNGGTLDGLTKVDGDTYATMFTPLPNYLGTASVVVGDGLYADLAGNNGDGGLVEFTVDTTSGPAVLIGTPDQDVLEGTPFDDFLDGRKDSDRMYGFAGNDTYVVDNSKDVVVEQFGEGIDTVRSTVNYMLGPNVENLILFDRDTVNGTGNELDNTITGTSGKNILDGGLGDDTLIGGDNNDTYIIDSFGDIIIEEEDGGSKDLVLTTITGYRLGANVENLTYIGSEYFFGAGNELNNTITGGDDNDLIDGAAGDDKMIGGLGDDTYMVDSKKDSITEAKNAGNDTIETSLAKYTLGKNLENLVFTGEGDFAATGNTADNTLAGGAGDDSLDGEDGADILVGGDGADTFVFHFGEANGDVVTDFTNAGQAPGDHLEFIGYGKGTLSQIDNTDFYLITPDAKHGGAAKAERIQLAGVTDLDLLQGSGYNDYMFM